MIKYVIISKAFRNVAELKYLKRQIFGWKLYLKLCNIYNIYYYIIIPKFSYIAEALVFYSFTLN